jgi:hypothetical protein
MGLISKIPRLIAIFLLPTLAVLTAQAQSAADHADPLIQAAELVEHARTLRAGCDYADAERWLRRAQSLIHDGRVRTAETDAAGNLAARIEIQRANLRDLRQRLDRDQQAVSRLIAQKQLAQARQRLQQAGFPACDARFEALKQQIGAAQYRLDHPPQCDSCRKVAKVVVWTAVLSGVGYGGWWAYDKYGHQPTPGSVSQPPLR